MKRFTPAKTKELCAALTVTLEQVNGIFQCVPYALLTNVLNSFPEISAENVVLAGDKGRLHVKVAEEIFLTFIWERYETTGNFEIIAYASSNHDDYREPFVAIYSTYERNTRRNRLNKKLSKLPNYHRSKGHIVAAIIAAVTDAGFDYYDLEDSTGAGAMCGSCGTLTVPISNNVFLTFTWYKMSLGDYELVAYAS